MSGRWRALPVRAHALVAVAALLTTMTLAGCASPTRAAGSPTDGRPLQVVTTFYPLEYLVERVGGSAVEVTDLAPPGVEPHDLELSPKDVARIFDADLVVYLSGFQAAVDTAVAAEAPATGWDVSPSADLSRTYTPTEELSPPADATPVKDPHFWLDPTRYAAVAEALAERLSTLQPAEASMFSANAQALVSELHALDHEWKKATATCANRDLVTSHTAFGYLAARYGFTQLGISGLSPETEPSAKTLATTADFVRAHRVSTIYYETLVSPAIAETIASETGAVAAALDPIEGLSDASNGADYFSIMRSDLATLVSGQGCT